MHQNFFFKSTRTFNIFFSVFLCNSTYHALGPTRVNYEVVLLLSLSKFHYPIHKCGII